MPRSFRPVRFAMSGALLWGAIITAHAAANPPDARFYASIGLGWSYAEPFVIDGTGAVIDYDFNPSVGSVALGMHAFEHWRVELDASLTDNAPEVLYVRGSGTELDTRGDDELRTVSIMLDLYRDFRFGQAFRPYLGVGIGAAHVSLRFIEYEPATGFENPRIDDSSWTFAYQAIAGLTVPISRHLGLGVEYRYWRAADLELEALNGEPLTGSQALHSGWLRLNYQPGGFRWDRAPDPKAARRSGFYVSGTLGGGWAPDRDFKYTEGQFDAFDIGPMMTFSAGYQFNGGWRLELEAARRSNGMEIHDTRAEEFRTKGNVVGETLSLNVGYRFRPGRAVNPYLSLGLGVSRIDYDLDLAATRAAFIDDTVTPAIVQWALGIDMALTGRWTITTDYRGMFSDHFTLQRTDGGTTTTTYLTHSMTIGARYSL